MANRFETEKKKRIASVRKKLQAKKADVTTIALADAVYEGAAGEDLTRYPAETLSALAEETFEFTTTRKGEKPLVRLTDLDEPDMDGRSITVVHLLNTDKPFLLDSVLGEIQSMGHQVRLVMHPIFEVDRDKSGKLTHFAISRPGRQSEHARESYIQVHVPRIRSKEDREALTAALTGLIADIHLVTDHWRTMRERLAKAIWDLRESPPDVSGGTAAETIAFLEWLEDNNFTFLGMREFYYRGLAEGTLEDSQGSGLGILSNPDVSVFRRGSEQVTITPEIRDFLLSPDPLIITKANVKSRVHRRDYMDYVGIKLFDDDGKVRGELRVVGLFTSSAFTRSVQRIPFIRRKVDHIVRRAGFDASSHSGKALLNVLEGYPRTELFQADEEILFENAMAILQLHDRPRVRVLARRDRFDRFVSILVFVPRERYSSEVRERLGVALADMYGGHVSAYFPSFPEGGLARVHFVIGRDHAGIEDPDQEAAEALVRSITRTWEDGLADAIDKGFPAERAPSLLAAWHGAFGSDYSSAFGAEDAVRDIETSEDLISADAIAAHFHTRGDNTGNRLNLRFHHRASPIPLSERVPLLENLGFQVINERTYRLNPLDSARVFIHDMTLEAAGDEPIDLETSGGRLRETVLAVWDGLAENDGFNALVLKAGLGWREAALLRGIGGYMRQAQVPYSPDYLWNTLGRYPETARLMVNLFKARFDPGQSDRDKATEAARKDTDQALNAVTSLDDDTILRGYRQVIDAIQRTDFFTHDEDGNPPLAITFKIKPTELPFVAKPRPFREIYVHSPEVDGVHMRFGPVARGGLRWSDRPQDFRVEVLGLVKAQQVKNAVIVPVGSKGGFYPKKLPAGGSREEIFEAGRHAYIQFIDRLLALTDDLEGNKVMPPKDVVRHDGDDPYLVVAADKGTATFSDTANAISQKHGFWLDDAFASGGSAGYDHKVMGITARGGWEAVKRHFREMDQDIQTEPFTAAGCGDMSGDVFGNGMLLSKATKLIAAFDHRDIFLDPDPDPAKSWVERKRLFDMGRSSWQDYDKALISKGGGVFSRLDKSVPLSAEVRKLLKFNKTSARPNEVINAILKMQVDLLWFGGIGTYIRATGESDAEVGDKTNDAVRVTAPEVGAKVIGEGANLGLTQRARIEYCQHGGRCNSDAIDNSAGVNSSDVEVNIKIALTPAVRSGKMTLPARNRLLKAMTDEVADLVLRNNYQQTLAISLEERRGISHLSNQGRLMASLEARDRLDRAVEFLPDDAALAERAAAGQPLTRPEIGVLLAYSKIVLFDDLVASDVPDDPYLEQELFVYFPSRMQKKMASEISSHRLRREIIATQLANSLINRGGPTIIVDTAERVTADGAGIARAFAAVRDSLDLRGLNGRIDALDSKVSGAVQLELYQTVQDALNQSLVWYLRFADLGGGLQKAVDHYRKSFASLSAILPDVLPVFIAKRIRDKETRFKAAKVPADLARDVAHLTTLARAADVVLAADRNKRKLADAARAYYGVTERFGFGRIDVLAKEVHATDYYDRLAVEKARDTLASAQRRLTEGVLTANKSKVDLGAWEDDNRTRIEGTTEKVDAILQDGRASTAKITVAASLLGELAGF
jgi:glutamate dehydrogenase